LYPLHFFNLLAVIVPEILRGPKFTSRGPTPLIRSPREGKRRKDSSYTRTGDRATCFELEKNRMEKEVETERRRIETEARKLRRG